MMNTIYSIFIIDLLMIMEQGMFDMLRDSLKEKYEYWGEGIIDADVMDFPKYTLLPMFEKLQQFKLYRYMPANYFNIRNFETQTIHLSSNGVMNDVYEGLPNTNQDLPYKLLQTFGDLAYMTCFSESNDNGLMWSHYANGHEGFCVEYDFKRLEVDPYGLTHHLFPVVYDEKRPISRDIASMLESKRDLDKAIEENYEYDGKEELEDILPMFLVKSKIWEYEREWRVIYTKKQMYDINDNTLYAGNIIMKCISAVYLGYRIHPEIKKNILEIVTRLNTQNYNISVFQTVLKGEGYDLSFEKCG